MEAKFRKGDQVILKSGGPSMKVKEIDEDSVRCTWFDPNVRGYRGIEGK